MNIGKLKRVPLREGWKHEAHDFTTWLQNNLEVLNEVLDFNLANAEREQSAGSFNIDLVAEDESGNPVIIENQLEKSDHDHLGKVITYLTAIDATTAIWIVAFPRPEHIKAITWLNESSNGSFYLIKLEAVRIGDSPAAPLLTLIVGPSPESREVGDTKKELAERHIIRRRFWQSLLENAKGKTKLHANISPSTDNWISAGSGRTGLSYNYLIRQHDTQVELYIGRGKAEENKVIFDTLYAAKDKIEASFGGSLDWQRSEHRQFCRVCKVFESGGYKDEDKWPQIQEAMIDAMIRLERGMKPELAKLKI